MSETPLADEYESIKAKGYQLAIRDVRDIIRKRAVNTGVVKAGVSPVYDMLTNLYTEVSNLMRRSGNGE